MGIKVHHMAEPVTTLQEIDQSSYHPNSGTPLFDAIGFTTLKLKEYLQGKTGYNVLVTIMTDGEENISKEFNPITIKKPCSTGCELTDTVRKIRESVNSCPSLQDDDAATSSGCENWNTKKPTDCGEGGMIINCSRSKHRKESSN